MIAKTKNKTGNALVVGAGIAGIQASLDLAELGIKVYLLEKTPNIGGVLSQLDKQFPTNHCGMCRMLPIFNQDGISEFCLRRGLRHPNIELISNAQVESVKGYPGEFIISINKKAKYIDPNKCIGCGRCVVVCPVEVKNEFEKGLNTRKAVYVKHHQVIPSVFVIDPENCTKCGECVKECPTDAIDLSMRDEKQELDVGTIIISSGFEEFDPIELTSYGYKRYPNVITNMELERILSEGGVYNGDFGRPSDRKIPQKVAFIQCVGSRDYQRNYCSSVCCMYAMKEATMLKEAYPMTQVYIFFMDLRAFGKNHYRYYENARRKGIKFISCKVSHIGKVPQRENLKITYETGNGKLISDEFGMVVLSVAQTPPKGVKSLSETFGIKLNEYGFCEANGTETSKDGIYACGSFAGPKDIESTIIEASAAASKASLYLSPCQDKPMHKEKFLDEAPNLAEEEPLVGIFVCRCGHEIAHRINIDEVIEFAKGLPGVSVAESIDYLCFSGGLGKVKNRIKRSRLNRIVLGACAIHSYKQVFSKTVKEVGVDPSLLEIVDLREQLVWVHEDKEMATNKARCLISMAYEKVKDQGPSPIFTCQVNPKALVIGGGISGLTAALSIAEQGFEVDLLERSSELGGKLSEIFYTLEGIEVQKLLRETTKKVENNPLIHVYKESVMKRVAGFAGNFKVSLQVPGDDSLQAEYGALIVATGAKEYKPKEYLYGKDERVITQTELEKRLPNSQFPVYKLQSVVMIQCVGSRDDEHPYCSRICCSQAIKNGLKIKEVSPTTNIFVLYRDIMTYGFREEYYTRAREQGIIFIRYDIEEKPTVNIAGDNLVVRVRDTVLQEELSINTDLLVLSSGIVPNNNRELADILGAPLTEDGFFKEMDTKFRPLEFTRGGIFCCGLAHSPRSIEESMAQANAVAAKVTPILSKGELKVRRIFPVVDEDICSGCQICTLICPYDARDIDEETRTSKVIGILCQGCGACVTACPNGATQQASFENRQILAMVDAGLEI